MVDPAGLVVGAVTLIGTFKDCVDLFLYIDSAQCIKRDYEILETKLEIEKTLFLQWAERVRLFSHGHYDRRLDDPINVKAFSRTLGSIRLLLSESQHFQDRYGLVQKKSEYLKNNIPRPGQQQITNQAASAISGSRLIRFINDFEKLNIGSKDKTSHVSPIGKFRWAVQDKDKFEKLIQELSYFISKLNELIPDKGKRIAIMTNKDSKERNSRMLELVYGASIDKEDEVAVIAEQNIWQKRILQSLRFRTMDDRRYSVAPPHSKTLNWALEPPESLGTDENWDMEPFQLTTVRHRNILDFLLSR